MPELVATHTLTDVAVRRQAMALHAEAGMSSREIGRMFAVSDSTARGAVRAYGHPRPRGGRRRVFSAADRDLMRSMRAEGLTCAAAARVLRTDPRSIREFYGSLPWAPREYVNEDGYVAHALRPDDPMAAMRRADGSVLKHRLVMARFLGRPLTEREQVHHLDGDRSHNAIENLQLRHGQHGKGIALRCACCGSIDIKAVEV